MTHDVGQIGEDIFHPVEVLGRLCHETPEPKGGVVDAGHSQSIDLPRGLPAPKGGPAHHQNRDFQTPQWKLTTQLPPILRLADEESSVSETEGLPHILEAVEDVLLREGSPSHG